MASNLLLVPQAYAHRGAKGKAAQVVDRKKVFSQHPHESAEDFPPPQPLKPPPLPDNLTG
ncbi:hypothetical protein [Tabrizicola oligotrophica]|uniref:Uncharacterized protein n=1 Tax=Tabrizicola oligotrophica TaxID=2710650 RepID=A0A6M0QQA9_9RHOB|nr:hypothetical protein [Tabrizicola oligotrophica]NEY89627.1 hypothetical protein [Tabrizicola oligotrophica]